MSDRGQNPKLPHARGVVATCPHCLNRTVIRTSRLLTPTFREVWGFCINCSFVGVASLSWERELAPSLLPNPEVILRTVHRQESVQAFLSAIAENREQLQLFNMPEVSILTPPQSGIAIDSG